MIRGSSPLIGKRFEVTKVNAVGVRVVGAKMRHLFLFFAFSPCFLSLSLWGRMTLEDVCLD